MVRRAGNLEHGRDVGLAMMRPVAVAVIFGIAVSIGRPGPSASSANGRTVSCEDAIGHVRFPYLGGNRPEERYRNVLGVIAAPPAYLPETLASRRGPWTHWRKQGLVVRAGSRTVTITVPEQWRTRAAITWGNSGAPTSSLRIEGCPGPADRGHAYAGGFLLRAPSACVPLTFKVGGRSATVRFGVGKRCRT